MLEPVALNQTRFNVPGVAPDNRGVVLGKQGALLFASVDRLVGFFRIFCDESSMDELLPKLKIHQVRTPLMSREFLVLYTASTSYLCDRTARIAALLGGLPFTGSGKHYVKYRDTTSPLGYDATALYGEPADFVLYADTFTQGYQRVKDVEFAQLIFRLSPRALPGTPADDLADRELLWLGVRHGLARSLLTYLWRNRVRAEAAYVEAADTTAGGGSFGQGTSFLLARVHELPPRMLALFAEVPGIEVFRPVGDNVVVQVGYRHPLRLESCATIFDKEKFYVFSGTRDAVDVLKAPPPLVPAGDLIGGGFDLGEQKEPAEHEVREPTSLEVQLKLVASATARRRVTATLVPWAHADRLRKLVYVLPPTMLATYRVAAIAEGLFVIGEQGIDGLPIGDMFQEAAPSIYVPLGCEFYPRVGAEVLTDHVGGVNGRYVVFPRGGRPLALEHAAFEPLGRRALARLEVDPRGRDARMPPPRATTPATVLNEDLSSLPLWGFAADKKAE
jgi:FtsH ternary system-associated peptide